jgi:hypothetical protein
MDAEFSRLGRSAATPTHVVAISTINSAYSTDLFIRWTDMLRAISVRRDMTAKSVIDLSPDTCRASWRKRISARQGCSIRGSGSALWTCRSSVTSARLLAPQTPKRQPGNGGQCSGAAIMSNTSYGELAQNSHCRPSTPQGRALVAEHRRYLQFIPSPTQGTMNAQEAADPKATQRRNSGFDAASGILPAGLPAGPAPTDDYSSPEQPQTDYDSEGPPSAASEGPTMREDFMVSQDHGLQWPRTMGHGPPANRP